MFVLSYSTSAASSWSVVVVLVMVVVVLVAWAFAFAKAQERFAMVWGGKSPPDLEKPDFLKVGATASTFGNAEIYIPNYASSNNKSVSADFVSETNAADAIFGLTAGLWANTSAITSIKLTPAAAFAQYSTATLYGIKNS